MSLHRIATVTYGLALVGTLGFGATQALAKPAAGGSAYFCDPDECTSTCNGMGYAVGECQLRYGRWNCVCSYPYY
jgi:hypothetical protein